MLFCGIQSDRGIKRGMIYLTVAAQLTLHFIGVPLMVARRQVRHETGEPHQIDHAKQRPPPAEDYFRIRRREVCPLRGNRANVPVVTAQQQPLAVTVVALADAGKLLAAQRMERMSDAYKVRRNAGSVCISS